MRKLAAVVLGLGLGLAGAPAPGARQILRWMNAARANPRYRAETGGKAAPLRWSARAAEVALRHAEEMARSGRLSHASADGPDPGTRLSRAGVDWSKAGENVGMAASLAQVEAMFMNEPRFERNHRGNILDRGYTAVGIGVARARDGLYYVAEDFFTPASAPPPANPRRSRARAAAPAPWAAPRPRAR
ncbi:MAG TPA: CAP domain-containing protein [Terriglobales bacterium]|nr:CAP domain-containing protein [Terriglobales bacterium]